MPRGMQVSRSGADLSRAASYDIIATSEWPTLSIISQGELNIVTSTVYDLKPITIFQHNRGYYCPFMCFEYYYTYDASHNKIYDTSRVKLEGSYTLFSHKDKLTTSPAQSAFQGFYILFDYDLNTPFNTGKNLASIPAPVTQSDKGLKVVNKQRRGSSIDSTDMRDFTTNTRARSLTVHMNGTQTVRPEDDYKLTIRHDLGYLPNFLLFKKDLTYGIEAITIEQNIITATETTISARGAQSVLLGEFYYIIFKEPFALGIP